MPSHGARATHVPDASTNWERARIWRVSTPAIAYTARQDRQMERTTDLGTMRQYTLTWSGAGGLAAAISLAITTGCSSVLPTPAAPSGRGWTTHAQGYHHVEASVSRSTTGNTTTTTTSVASGFTNVTHRERVTAEDVRRTLRVGANVADFKFNRSLAKEVGR